MNFLRSLNIFKCFRPPRSQESEEDYHNLPNNEPIVWFQPGTQPDSDDDLVRILHGAANILDSPIEVPAQEEDVFGVVKQLLNELIGKVEAQLAVAKAQEEPPKPVSQPLYFLRATPSTPAIDRFLVDHLGCTEASCLGEGAFASAWSVKPGPKLLEAISSLTADSTIVVKVFQLEHLQPWMPGFQQRFKCDAAQLVRFGYGLPEKRFANFQDETRALQAIPAHPNIVSYLGAIQLFYNSKLNQAKLVCGHEEAPPTEPGYELAFGGILLEKLDTDVFVWSGEQKRGFTLEEAVNCFVQVAHALEHLHEVHHICHNDIKDDNVGMNFEANGRITFKLFDFGLAKQHTEEEWQEAQRKSAPLVEPVLEDVQRERNIGTAAFIKIDDFKRYIWNAQPNVFLRESGMVAYMLHLNANLENTIETKEGFWYVDQKRAHKRPFDLLMRRMMAFPQPSFITLQDALVILRKLYPDILAKLDA